MGAARPGDLAWHVKWPKFDERKDCCSRSAVAPMLPVDFERRRFVVRNAPTIVL